MSNTRRKEIVARLRAEGALAARTNKHPDTCPYQYMDKFQWQQGYRIEKRVMKAELEVPDDRS